jgi:Zn-dependent protease
VDIASIGLIAPVLLFSVIAHEYAHGYAALKQGDETALKLGRLTLNPIKHIDPVMTILLPAVLLWAGQPVLGGAKPVPVDPRNYREPKKGDIIVSLAGVATNLAIALACTVLFAVLGLVAQVIPAAELPLSVLQAMCAVAVVINIELLFFNLLPMPPLDGSHVMKYLLPPAWAIQYQRLGFYGLFILILLLRTPFLIYWLTPGFMLIHGLHSVVAGLTMPDTITWLSRTGLLGWWGV